MSDLDSGAAPGIAAAGFDPQLFSALFDALPDSVVVVSRNSRCLFANTAALAFSGLSREAAVGRGLEDLFGPGIQAGLQPALETALSGGTAAMSGWISGPGGARQFAETAFAPWRRPDGTAAAAIGFIRDQTALKAREAQIAQLSEAHAAAENVSAEIIRTGMDAIIVTDADGRVISFNPAAEAMFGFRQAEAAGKPVVELIIPEADRAAHQAGMARHRLTGETRVLGKRLEREAVNARSEKFPVELTISEVKLPGRSLYTAHLRDLRPSRLAEAQIKLQTERLHNVEKLSAMGSLLAGVAHELNNPLAILLAQSTLLLETAPTDSVRNRAERIHSATERSARIIKSFLALARQKPPSRSRVDLNALALQTLEMIGYGLRTGGVSVETALAAGLPSVMLDDDLFRQVIANLVVNAQQALSQREQPRRLKLSTFQAAGHVAFEIEDNGPGVPKDIAERIFDPFFTTKPAGAGTGIGLAVCNDIVKAHGGRIELAASRSGGAVFRVIVPTPAAEDAESRPGAPAIGPRQESILIVDDETDVGESLSDILGLLGHQAEVASSASDALKRIEAEPFTRVFVDLRMPEMNGDAFIERLAEIRPALAARTVLMTGDTVRGPAALLGSRAASLGVKILEKPFSIEDVRAIIK